MTPTATVVDATGSMPEITSIVHDLRNPLSAIYGGSGNAH